MLLAFYVLFTYSFQSEPKTEVEHADILELNTIIGTLKTEKDELEKEMVGAHICKCVCMSDDEASMLPKLRRYPRMQMVINEKTFV